MEVGLGETEKWKDYVRAMQVLILVLMEVGLGVC